MRLSRTIFKSQKNRIHGLDSTTDRLMRACFICKESAGIFSFTPLGYRVLENVKDIIDLCFATPMNEGNEDVYIQKVSLPILQHIDHWIASGRAQAYGDETFKLTNRDGHEFLLAPTAEESVVNMVKSFLDSYKTLGITLYQMIHKYRDELRPRFGLVRNKEFIMKDAYSFDKNVQECRKSYARMYLLYDKIFTVLGIDYVFVAAECGEVGGSFSQNAFVVSETGEDKINLTIPWSEYAKKVKAARTYEEMAALSQYVKENGSYQYAVMEIGHIFDLGDKYSKSMNLTFCDESGQEIFPQMGCYGIGVTRLVHHLMRCDAEHKPMPFVMAPYPLHMISINRDEDGDYVYKELIKIFHHHICLYDDREIGAGTKFHDADLIGIPNRITLGKTIELKNQTTQTFSSLDELINHIKQEVEKGNIVYNTRR